MGSSGRRERILLIEDDTLVRRSLIRQLSTPFDVVGVPSTDHAFDRLDRGETFDAVLCDMYLESNCRDGRDFYERVLARHPELGANLILISGAPPPEDAFGCAVARRWLMKPFRTTEVVALLERLREPRLEFAA